MSRVPPCQSTKWATATYAIYIVLALAFLVVALVPSLGSVNYIQIWSVFPPTVLAGYFGLAIACIVVAVLNAYALKQVAMLRVHIFMIAVTFILLALMIAYSIFIGLEGSSIDVLSERWNVISNNNARAIQEWGTCCGFNDLRDRFQPVCPVGALQGCASALLESYDKLKGWILVTSIIITALLAIGLSLNCVALWKWTHEKGVSEPKDRWTVPIFK